MKPHKHAELIKAWADGAEIEMKVSEWHWVYIHKPHWDDDVEYRIKPEKPDVVKYANAWTYGIYGAYEDLTRNPPNLKLTFDGETGELKSAEVLK